MFCKKATEQGCGLEISKENDEEPNKIVTDKLRSYGAALKEIGGLNLQDSECYLNNSCENSHLPFLSLIHI